MLSIFLLGFFSPVTAQYETPLLSHGPIAQLVLGSEQIVQGVFYLLFFSSVASWGIIFYKFYQVYLARRLAGRFRAAFEGSDDLTSLYAASLKMNANPLIAVFHAGYQELRRLARTPTPPTPHHSPAAPNEGRMEKVERAMRRAVREQTAWLEHALPFLATTASTAPFIGLFGTVCGIVHAFHGLSRRSPPVSKRLPRGLPRPWSPLPSGSSSPFPQSSRSTISASRYRSYTGRWKPSPPSFSPLPRASPFTPRPGTRS